MNTKHIRGLNIPPQPQQPQQQQQQQQIDTNVDNYSVSDLLTIFNLIDVDEPTLFQIKDVANNLIARMKSEGKMDMAVFFEKAKQKVISEMERDTESDTDTDTETDTDIETDNKKHNNSASSSLICGDNWWEQDYPIKSQHSRQPPQHNVGISCGNNISVSGISGSNGMSVSGSNSNGISNSNSISNSKTNIQMIEYEKNIILEKLKMTEMKLREVEKENKKLKKQVKLLLDR